MLKVSKPLQTMEPGVCRLMLSLLQAGRGSACCSPAPICTTDAGQPPPPCSLQLLPSPASEKELFLELDKVTSIWQLLPLTAGTEPGVCSSGKAEAHSQAVAACKCALFSKQKNVVGIGVLLLFLKKEEVKKIKKRRFLTRTLHLGKMMHPRKTVHSCRFRICNILNFHLKYCKKQ